MNEQLQTAQSDEVEIDLREVWGVLARHFLAIILALVIGAGAIGAYSEFIITPQYSATSMIYILTKTTSITSLADLQMGSQLTVDFQTLATSRPVVEQVINKLGLNTTYESLVKTIKVENPTNTRILKTTVTNPDPELAMKISNAMSDSIAEQVATVMTTDKPTNVEQAVVPSAPSSPNVTRNAVIGGIAAALLAIVIVLARYFMNDTIKDDDDVEKYLHTAVLATFPLERELKSRDSAPKRERKKA